MPHAMLPWEHRTARCELGSLGLGNLAGAEPAQQAFERNPIWGSELHDENRWIIRWVKLYNEFIIWLTQWFIIWIHLMMIWSFSQENESYYVSLDFMGYHWIDVGDCLILLGVASACDVKLIFLEFPSVTPCVHSALLQASNGAQLSAEATAERLVIHGFRTGKQTGNGHLSWSMM